MNAMRSLPMRVAHAVSSGLDAGGAAGPSRSLRSCIGGGKCEPGSQVWGVQAVPQDPPDPYAAA